jgi:hypothetical protein
MNRCPAAASLVLFSPRPDRRSIRAETRANAFSRKVGNAWSDSLKPLHAPTFGDTPVPAYIGLIAFAGDVVTAVIINVMIWRRGSTRS